MIRNEDISDWNKYTDKVFAMKAFSGGHYCLENNRDEAIDFLKSKIYSKLRG